MGNKPMIHDGERESREERKEWYIKKKYVSIYKRVLSVHRQP